MEATLSRRLCKRECASAARRSRGSADHVAGRSADAILLPGSRGPGRAVPRGDERVVVFHVGYVGDEHDWKAYDWSIVTTLIFFGPLSPDLYCHAHAHGARVVASTGLWSYEASEWEKSTSVSRFIAACSLKLQGKWDGRHEDGYWLDGFNVDGLRKEA